MLRHDLHNVHIMKDGVRVRKCSDMTSTTYTSCIAFFKGEGGAPYVRGGALHTILILLSFMRIRTHSRKENNSLCFSKRDLHTLLYRLKVKYSLIFRMRWTRSSEQRGNKGIERGGGGTLAHWCSQHVWH